MPAALLPLALSTVVLQEVPTYTSEQAAAGAELYENVCSACHLADLSGSFEATPLPGPNFRINWEGRPVPDLVEVIRATMPPGLRARWASSLRPR